MLIFCKSFTPTPPSAERRVANFWCLLLGAVLILDKSFVGEAFGKYLMGREFW